MNHFDNGPQEFGQEERREESHTLSDGPQGRTGAIPYVAPDGATMASTTTGIRRSTRQMNAASASRGRISGCALILIALIMSDFMVIKIIAEFYKILHVNGR